MESQTPGRRSIRLLGYDYASPGAYFVTICAQDRECLFGNVADGEMCSSAFGDLLCQAWNDLPNHYPHVALDAFVVMPNHMHGIVLISETTENVVGAGLRPAPTEPAPTKPAPPRHGLPEIVRAFKTFSARRINELRGTPGASVWQRGYYEHIVRDEADLQRIRQYIQDSRSAGTGIASTRARFRLIHPRPECANPGALERTFHPKMKRHGTTPAPCLVRCLLAPTAASPRRNTRT